MKNHFDEMAKDWDNPETIQRNQQFAQAIKEFVPFEGKRILDFGCGTGLLASYLYSAEGYVFGIDSSAGMVEHFAQRFKELNNVHFLSLDIEKNHFPAEIQDIDLVVTAMAFHHLIDPQKVLHQLSKILKVNGYIFVIDLEKEDGSFHPDNIAMGVKHFGFSMEQQSEWIKNSNLKLIDRKKVFSINKNERDYPIMMAIFQKVEA